MHTIQLLGLLGAASYAMARGAQATGLAAWHRYAIVAQPRDRLPAMPRGFAVREMTQQTLAPHAVDASPEVQARRFDAGLTCLASFDPAQRLTGLIWLGQRHYDEDEVRARFLLPRTCCWDTGLWIAPQFRMGRSFMALWAGVGAWMDRHGLSHSLSRISDYNLPALLSQKRMGAEVLDHHAFLRFGPWQWSRRASPRLVRSETPEIDLTAWPAQAG